MASKRAKRRASCEGKKRHEHIADAKRHALMMRDKYNDRSYNYYRCPFCNGWHVGRRSKSKRQSAIAKSLVRQQNRRKRHYFKNVLK
jgi:hypothetical protein